MSARWTGLLPLLCGLMILGLAGCGPAIPPTTTAGDWAKPAPAGTMVELPPGASLEVVWKFDAGSPISSSPTVAGGRVFFGSHDGYLYALDANTGQKDWGFHVCAHGVYSTPAVADGVVYVGRPDLPLDDDPSVRGYFYALDARTGQERWTLELEGPVFASATTSKGSVYFADWNRLYALDVRTGDQRWAAETNRTMHSSPTVSDGTVYIGGSQGQFFALDAATGEQKWELQVGGIICRPAVSGGLIYICSHDHHVYALDTQTGEERWSAEVDIFGVYTSPIVSQGTLYIGSLDRRLYALDAQTGEQKWTFETGAPVLSTPTVSDGMVYSGSTDGRLYVLDAQTGALVGGFDTGRRIYSAPAVAGGLVYFGSWDGYLYALKVPASPEAGLPDLPEDGR